MLGNWFGDIRKEYNLPLTKWGESFIIDIPQIYFNLYAGIAALPLCKREKDKEEFWDFVERIRVFFADYLLASCLGEARHLYNQSYFVVTGEPINGNPYIPLLKTFNGDINCPTRSNGSRELWNFTRTSNITPQHAFILLEEIFSPVNWYKGLGGPNWGFLCVIGSRLWNATTPIDVILTMDLLTNACHAGNVFLNSGRFSNVYSGSMTRAIICFKREARRCCWNKTKVDSLWNFYGEHEKKNTLWGKAIGELQIIKLLNKQTPPQNHICFTPETTQVINSTCKEQEDYKKTVASKYLIKEGEELTNEQKILQEVKKTYAHLSQKQPF